MTSNSPPSRNPADNDSMPAMMDFVLKKFLQKTDDMLPAEVLAYDRTTNRARVKPLIVMVTTDNQQVVRGEIASVPVLQIGGGGFVLSFPVNVGDLGWIKANDRDISLFLKSYTSNPPNTQRLHEFSDALFIPDSMMRGVTINGEDTANAVLQTLDGSVRISIWPDKIKMTAPTIEIDSDVHITGALTVDGIVTGAGVNLDTHRHSGVQTGSGDTGPPV